MEYGLLSQGAPRRIEQICANFLKRKNRGAFGAAHPKNRKFLESAIY
jgi:hypothetical protein